MGYVDPSFIPCPHCGRSFNQRAGERHIPQVSAHLHPSREPSYTLPQCASIINKPNRLNRHSGQLSYSTNSPEAAAPRSRASMGASTDFQRGSQRDHQSSSEFGQERVVQMGSSSDRRMPYDQGGSIASSGMRIDQSAPVRMTNTNRSTQFSNAPSVRATPPSGREQRDADYSMQQRVRSNSVGRSNLGATAAGRSREVTESNQGRDRGAAVGNRGNQPSPVVTPRTQRDAGFGFESNARQQQQPVSSAQRFNGGRTTSGYPSGGPARPMSATRTRR